MIDKRLLWKYLKLSTKRPMNGSWSLTSSKQHFSTCQCLNESFLLIHLKWELRKFTEKLLSFMTDGTTLQRNPSTITDFPTIVPKKRHTEFFPTKPYQEGWNQQSVACHWICSKKKRKYSYCEVLQTIKRIRRCKRYHWQPGGLKLLIGD